MTISSLSSCKQFQNQDYIPSTLDMDKISLMAINLLGYTTTFGAIGGTIGSWFNREACRIVPFCSKGTVYGIGLGALFGFGRGLSDNLAYVKFPGSVTTQAVLIGASAVAMASKVATVGTGIGYATGLGTLPGMGLGAALGFGLDLLNTTTALLNQN